jgi:hypothetical protein
VVPDPPGWRLGMRLLPHITKEDLVLLIVSSNVQCFVLRLILANEEYCLLECDFVYAGRSSMFGGM